MFERIDELRADVQSVIRKFLFVGAFANVLGVLLLTGAYAPELLPGARAPGWVLGLAGVFSLLLGWLAWSYGPRWYRRVNWVAQTVAPSVMRLRIKIAYDADKSRSLRALLYPDNAGAEAPPAESLSVQWPSWDAETLPEGPVEVLRDPQPGGPVIIRTPRGWLLPAPGGRIGRRGPRQTKSPASSTT